VRWYFGSPEKEEKYAAASISFMLAYQSFQGFNLQSTITCCFQVGIQTWNRSYFLSERLEGIAKGRD